MISAVILLALVATSAVAAPASAPAGLGSGYAISPVGAPFSAGAPPGGAGPAFGPPGAFGPAFPGFPGAAGGAPPGMAMPSEPTCPPTNGMVPLYVPDPDDCTKYTVCSGGFGMKLDCAPGLHFNKLTNHCDYPPIAQCEEIPPEDPTTLTGPPGIKKDAYFDMSLLSGPGFPMIFGQPNPGIGQLKNPPGQPPSAPAA
uniref:Putative peritrophin n=1 Tax=Amblyomma cajennense TaxID=34607 RepID=A0A023FRY8_AMBCJ